MIITLSDEEKAHWRELWKPCRCTVSGWSGVDDGRDVPAITDSVVVVTAADPYGLDLSDAENARLDRKFGQDVRAAWWRVLFTESHRETRGYMFRYEDASIDLVRQANQLAAFVFIEGKRNLLWHDGSMEPFPVPR